jgi:manganese/iron transport system permease protein
MLSPAEFLTDLTNPALSFLPKALFVALMSSAVCGVIGCYVVLRGMAFIGDAVAHAVFPGLAVAFVIQGNLVLGGAIAGVLTAVAVAVFAQNRRLREDSVIGVFFVGAFALGIVIISQAPGYAGSLQQFLFGSITGIPDEDLYVVAVSGTLLLGLVFVLHKEFVAVTLDRETARAAGLPVFALDLALYVMVAVAVVISVQTIGNILVLALLITPAAAARLLTDRLGVMMALAPLIGGASALVGLYLSWSLDLPTGGTIVLVATAIFLLACERLGVRPADCLYVGDGDGNELHGATAVVMRAVRLIKAGDLETAQQALAPALRSVAKAGAGMIVAACTELPLVLGHRAEDLPVFDPTTALAQDAVALARRLPYHAHTKERP